MQENGRKIDDAFRHESRECLDDYSNQFKQLTGANPGG
jgi:hypothetical protein